VDLAWAETGRLRDMLADVVALRIEAHCLKERVEDAVRPGVRAGACHPLPVARVAGQVAVHEQIGEVGCSKAPVQANVLDEKRGGQELRAAVDPALAKELAHRRIDDRVSGAALTPGGERIIVLEPQVPSRPVVVVREPGPRRQELEVEVAPAELAQERLIARPAGDAAGDLDR
jgi:hypothetical protein